MQRINRIQCQKSAAEAWMADKLASTGMKWTRQAQWGYRLFDFWSAKLGVAVEVDGSEHKKEYDAYRDEYNYRRSGIIVLRVRNMNEEDAQKALLEIASCKEDWRQRRKSMGIEGSKKQKSHLADMPYADGQRMAGVSV